MADIAIKVENLSKSYLVGHNSAQAERYSALRDVLSRNARNLVRKTRDMLRGRAIVQGDEVEEFWALKDVSFEIRQGDKVGIIGRNGAGKSTLLKILSRITEPVKGRIQINGRVASLLEVGTGFHPELTGRENIFLNGAILGMSRVEIRKKFDEIVEFAEIQQFLDTPVKRYSSGMYVRLAFAVAAHLDPDILLVDEVLAVGDAAFQKKCLGKMQTISDSGRTILFVSHNMSAVSSFCQKCLLLNNGRLELAGPVPEVIGRYFNHSHIDMSSKRWTSANAPGSPEVRILGVTVKAAGGDVGASIGIKDPIEVITEYDVLPPGMVAHLTYVLVNDQGVTCFSTFGDPVYHGPGIYRRTFVILGNLLNSGHYFLNLYVVRNASQHVFEYKEIAGFEVSDNEPRLGGWMGREPGILRPSLAWTHQQLSEVLDDAMQPKLEQIRHAEH